MTSLFVCGGRAQAAAEAAMNFMTVISLPLALLGLEVVACVLVFHEIFDNVDLGFFTVRFLTTKNVKYAMLCNLVACAVSVSLLVNKWLPIGRAPEDEDAERQEAKGFLVYGSDANFRARVELKEEEEEAKG